MKNLAFLSVILVLLFCSCVSNTNNEDTNKNKAAIQNEEKDDSTRIQSADSQFTGKYLIVLDMQQFPVSKNLPEPLTIDQIKPVNQVIENSDPEKVIYVKSASMALSVSLKGISVDTVSIPDFDQRLKIVNSIHFVKTRGNAFKSRNLVDFLKRNEVREIVVVGLLAEQCVYKTILGGKKLGFDMYTVSEAIIGKTPESKEKTIQLLADKGVNFLTIE